MSAALSLAGLRALVDCGAIMSRSGEPKHLKAAAMAGWAEHRSTWTGKTFAHLYVLKIDRARAAFMLPVPRAHDRVQG